jgi:hypothetical protein
MPVAARIPPFQCALAASGDATSAKHAIGASSETTLTNAVRKVINAKPVCLAVTD